MSLQEIYQVLSHPIRHAYKSSSPASSVNPAFPDVVPAGALEESPSGNLKLFPKPRDCCKFYSKHEDTVRMMEPFTYLGKHLITSDVLI